ncbi:hypothetical protein [Aquimarina algiphila]|uniref:Uncharacterized protein n=1 Tax=Aquimarina algiphila TaxID=2047982 RepID=A0A554VCB3_9FLAO|nr:hypothetical protein [Aquimarina algiphila]TSE04358.1 hypothetical protein FOF46_26390 [Aquimarina algiphila]
MSNVFLAQIKSDDFDKKDDKIAVVIKEFTLLKNADWFLHRYSEPYIISMAIDQGGANNPAIDFNILPFPNVKKGDIIQFDGHGHLVYGPKNPGEFLAYSVLFMESDKDIRDLGQLIEDIIKSDAASIGVNALLSAVTTYATAINVLTQLTSLLSKKMQENKDDELFRRNGTLLRDVDPPFDILRTYKGRNDYIESKVSIIPLLQSNGLGPSSKMIKL